jgi:hypothetical protein
MAYKALDYFIDGKVSSRDVKLSISKPNMLSKLINLGKCIFRYFVRF